MAIKDLDLKYQGGAIATGKPVTVGGKLTAAGALVKGSETIDALPNPAGINPPNYRPRWLDASSVVSRGQATDGWTGSTGFAADTTDFIMGTQSLKMPSNGAGGTFKIERTGLSLDTTAKQIRLRMKVDVPTKVFQLSFYAGNDSGYVNAYRWDIVNGALANQDIVPANQWVTVTLNVASATLAGTPTRTGITALKATIRDDSTGAVTLRLQSVELIDEPVTQFPNGLVSLSFDDTYLSQWTLAKAKMDALGYRGSLYLIEDFLDAGFAGSADRLTTDQVLAMQAQGWEVGAHSQTNADHTATYVGLSAAALEADLRTQVQNMRAKGFRVTGAAYPQGAFGTTTDGVKTTEILRKYFAYCRTTSRRLMETWPAQEPFILRAQSAITTAANGYAPSNIYGAGGDLDKAKANHAWMILNFHDLLATGTPATTSQTLASDFNAIIDKIAANGMTVLPIGEAMQYSDDFKLQPQVQAIQSSVAAITEPPVVEPADHGIKAWTYDPSLAVNASTPVAGSLYLSRVYVRKAIPATSVMISPTSNNGTMTAGQCFLGIYDAAGTLVASTADISGLFTTSAVKTVALTTPVTLQPGAYWVGILLNGTGTIPSLSRGTGSGVLNAGISLASQLRYATNGAALTALPSTITPSSNTASVLSIWAGIA